MVYFESILRVVFASHAFNLSGMVTPTHAPPHTQAYYQLAMFATPIMWTVTLMSHNLIKTILNITSWLAVSGSKHWHVGQPSGPFLNPSGHSRWHDRRSSEHRGPVLHSHSRHPRSSSCGPHGQTPRRSGHSSSGHPGTGLQAQISQPFAFRINPRVPQSFGHGRRRVGHDESDPAANTQHTECTLSTYITIFNAFMLF